MASTNCVDPNEQAKSMTTADNCLAGILCANPVLVQTTDCVCLIDPLKIYIW